MYFKPILPITKYMQGIILNICEQNEKKRKSIC